MHQDTKKHEHDDEFYGKEFLNQLLLLTSEEEYYKTTLPLNQIISLVQCSKLPNNQYSLWRIPGLKMFALHLINDTE